MSEKITSMKFNEAELLAEYETFRVQSLTISEKMDEHFGPLIDLALSQDNLQEAKEILKRIPESPCRFYQWKKIHYYENK